MLQHAARRACVTPLTRGRLHRWGISGLARPQRRSRSSTPVAASDLTIWANGAPALTLDQEQGESIVEQSLGGRLGRQESSLAHAPAALRQQITTLLKSNKGSIHPEIIDVVARTHKGSGSLNRATDVFTIVATAYGRAGRPHLTLDLCQAVQDTIGEPFVPSTARGLLLLLDAMNPKVASLAANDHLVGPQAVRTVLRRYEAAQNDLPVEAYTAAVRALDDPGLCSTALELTREARAKFGDAAEGLAELYDVVTKQCIKHRDADVAVALLREREAAGRKLAPSTHAYAATLSCLSKAGRVADAVNLFSEMLEQGHKPEEIDVNSVLAACAKDAPKYWRHAKAIFEGMESRWGVSANIYHYTSFVTCLLKVGQWSEAIALIDKMEAEGVSPNSRFLEHMMQAGVTAKQWVTAEAIFRAMSEKYGHAAVVSRQSTLHFLQSMVMQKKLRKAISYVARIQHIALRGSSTRVTLDGHLLRCFRKIPGVGSEALAGVLMTMLDRGVKVHPDSYSVVIAKANEDGNTRLSETIYKMLIADRSAPSLSAANAAIKGASDIDSGMAIVASLAEHGLTPDKFTYSALLHCCSKARGEQDNTRRARKATEVWNAMLGAGIVPHGGMLASYVQALMKAGDWQLALEIEKAHGGARLSSTNKHVDKLALLASETAVVHGVVANGLVGNGQPALALEYVLGVLREKTQDEVDGGSERKYFMDEDNHTVLAGIRACKVVGSCEVAMGLLEACEARWAQGPVEANAEDGMKHAWRAMHVRTRKSRRRLYDALITLLDEKGAEWSDIRGVLLKGMGNGAVSFMKDQQGGNDAEQAIEFHGWSPGSAHSVMRCILEDIAGGRDFLLDAGQYDLGRVAFAQGLREYGDVSERWHVDSPDPRGRRREFVDGAKPARFGEREYGKGRKGGRRRPHRPQGGWDGQGADMSQAHWWTKGQRLSIVVGKPRPPPSVRNSVEELCMLGATPPLRVRQDPTNPGLLNLEAEDVRAWLDSGGKVLTR